MLLHIYRHSLLIKHEGRNRDSHFLLLLLHLGDDYILPVKDFFGCFFFLTKTRALDETKIQ